MWKDIFRFRGRWNRLNRMRFFLYNLVPFGIIAFILISFSLVNTLFSSDSTLQIKTILNFSLYFLGILTTLLLMWISISLGVKRLHDLGHSGWWVVFVYVPYINILYTIYVLFWPGQKGQNAYGPDPLEQK